MNAKARTARQILRNRRNGTEVLPAAKPLPDLAGFKSTQIADAAELIADGGAVRLRGVIFLTLSTDGTETHRTAPNACTCKAGIRGTHCYHTAAVRMLLAA